MNIENIILSSDSYKYSQYNQYPSGTTHIYSYIESRGSDGKYDSAVFFGLQAFLRRYLTKRITLDDINTAEEIILAHGLPFYRKGWEYIVENLQGNLPVEIKSADEGSVVPLGNILLSIVNTDPKCYWLTSFLETALLRAIWYPTTVATNSYKSRQIIMSCLEETGTPEDIDFKLHDFGARGVSSLESAALGGMAHLVNFNGTDTVSALIAAKQYYGADMAGFSIPAMEHSTVTSWGRENEEDAYRNMLTNYAREGSLVACVSDSYDIFKACEMWGTKLKEDVVNSGATVVIRPDSGHPPDVVSKCAKILAEHFGTTTNKKGYKVLNNVRLIQGDGINHEMISSILIRLISNGFSADNIAFGQGGALLQAVDRDTLQFAMKCSAAKINGQWVDVYKEPITDSGKASKKGRMMLVDREGYQTIAVGQCKKAENLLKLRYRNGKYFNHTTLDKVRNLARNNNSMKDE